MKKTNTDTKPINRVCIVGVVYALFLYLLKCSKEEIEHTFFFVNSPISRKIASRLPYSQYIPFSGGTTAITLRNKVCSFAVRAVLRLISRFRWRFLHDSEIFAQDHIRMFSPLMDDQNYTLLADGPNCFGVFRDLPLFNATAIYSDSISGKIIGFFVGPLFSKGAGRNKQCKRIWLEKHENVSYLQSSLMEEIDMKAEWDASSACKRDMILDIFNLTPTTMALVKSRPVILLTQPLALDAHFSEAEQINIYSDLLREYDMKDIIIKAHPRDTVNYKKYFPEALILDSPIPMQFFNIIGLDNIKTAITVCSSSVSNFKSGVNIIFAGTDRYPAVKKVYGSIKLEDYIIKQQ